MSKTKLAGLLAALGLLAAADCPCGPTIRSPRSSDGNKPVRPAQAS